MAHALRKTVRKKHSRRSHFFGFLLMAVLLCLIIAPGETGWTLTSKKVLDFVLLVLMVLVHLFEDRLNGYIARKRMIAGANRSKTVFSEDCYRSETDIGKTEWSYKTTRMIAEDNRYFVFLFDYNHAQVYDKQHLSGGTEAEFRAFLTEKTGKEIIKIA